MEPHTGLNTIDYCVIATILVSALLAFVRGFSRELFSLIAWTGAGYAAYHWHDLLTPWMHHYIKKDKPAEWAAIAAMFLGVLVFLMALGSVISSQIKGQTLTHIDRSLGFVYGLARGALVASLLYLAAVMIFWPDIDAPKNAQAETEQPKDADRNVPPDLLVQAKTRPMLIFGAGLLKEMIPQDMVDKTLKNVEEQNQTAAKTMRQLELDKLSTPTPLGQIEDKVDLNRHEGKAP
jgi:membrane protein required for colicin V production